MQENSSDRWKVRETFYIPIESWHEAKASEGMINVLRDSRLYLYTYHLYIQNDDFTEARYLHGARDFRENSRTVQRRRGVIINYSCTRHEFRNTDVIYRVRRTSLSLFRSAC